MYLEGMGKSIKGKFRPKNPQKYKGDPTMIEFRSSWERTFMNWADLRENVISWQSEEGWVSYYDPIQKKQRRYFPDFLIKVRDSDGLIRTQMVEIKPYKEVVGPDPKPKRRTKSWAYAVQTYVTNMAKWEAARKVCKQKGWEFVIITERELGLTNKK